MRLEHLPSASDHQPGRPAREDAVPVIVASDLPRTPTARTAELRKSADSEAPVPRLKGAVGSVPGRSNRRMGLDLVDRAVFCV